MNMKWKYRQIHKGEFPIRFSFSSERFTNLKGEINIALLSRKKLPLFTYYFSVQITFHEVEIFQELSKKKSHSLPTSFVSFKTNTFLIYWTTIYLVLTYSPQFSKDFKWLMDNFPEKSEKYNNTIEKGNTFILASMCSIHIIFSNTVIRNLDTIFRHSWVKICRSHRINVLCI